MLDAIVIADAESTTYSGSSPLRLQIQGGTAWIQTVRKYLDPSGALPPGAAGTHKNNWHYSPKLNGVRLHSYLEKESYSAALIDSYFDERARFITLLGENPRAVVISTTFISSKKALARLVSDIRGVAPDAYIIAGGALIHSSYLLLGRAADASYDTSSPREDYLFLSPQGDPGVDLYIVDSGGEPILAEALRRLKHGGNPAELPNTCTFNGHEYVFTSRQQLPACDMLVDWTKVPEQVFATGSVNVQASRGCPFRCEFCNFVRGREAAAVKPLDALIKELRDICARGVRYVRFVDDNFRLGRKDLSHVCAEFIAAGLDARWMTFLRASTLAHCDPELLRRAGCVEVHLGVESAAPTVLQNMNKRSEPDLYRRVLRRLLAAGINCTCFFVVGFPGETDETIQRTLEFINIIPQPGDEGLLSWSFFPFLLAPLSPVYEPDRRRKYGLEGYLGRWKHATMNAEQAREHVRKAFMTISGSSQFYSGDDLDMLSAMTHAERRRFVETRHQLSKAALGGGLDEARVRSALARALS